MTPIIDTWDAFIIGGATFVVCGVICVFIGVIGEAFWP